MNKIFVLFALLCCSFLFASPPSSSASNVQPGSSAACPASAVEEQAAAGTQKQPEALMEHFHCPSGPYVQPPAEGITFTMPDLSHACEIVPNPLTQGSHCEMGNPAPICSTSCKPTPVPSNYFDDCEQLEEEEYLTAAGVVVNVKYCKKWKNKPASGP